MTTIVQAHVVHAPRNAFASGTALETFSDGAVAFEDGRFVAGGSFAEVRVPGRAVGPAPSDRGNVE
jgi:hypothetical protein